MDRVTIQDLYQIKTMEAPCLSPNGSYATFVVVQPAEDGFSYTRKTYLWNAADGQTVQMPAGPFFGWYDDGHYLSVAQGDNGTALCAVSVKTWERETLIPAPQMFSGVRKVDSHRWVFSVPYDIYAPQVETMSPEEAKLSMARFQEERKRYRIIEEIPYRIDGVGYINGIRIGLYLFDSKDNSFVPLTDRGFSISMFDVSADGKNLVLCGRHGKNPMRTPAYGLYRIDLDSRNMYELIPDDTLAITAVRIVGDRIRFASARPRYSGVSYECDLDPKQLREIPLQGGEQTVLGKMLPDVSAVTLREADALFIVDYETRHALARIAPNASYEILTDEDHSFVSCDSRGGRTIAVGFEPNGLQELYEVAEDGAARRLTDFNQTLLSSRVVSDARPLSFVNRDGIRIDGFVLQPSPYVPGRKYPGILEIHGGPRVDYWNDFDIRLQALASAGYFVFYCNPRGSSGRGDEFAQLGFENQGTYDYEDLMEFVDNVLAQYPDVDADRLGVCGGSYGGYMTSWIVTQTDRFKAAIPQRAITDQCCFLDHADQGAAPYMRAPDYAKLWEQSPMAHVHKVKTPTMVVQGASDYTTPTGQGLSFFSGLIRAGVETRLLLIEGEGHGINRTGTPINRETLMTEMQKWFDRYLKA